jgi:glutamyl/glutaminyl-tRNA synthetase
VSWRFKVPDGETTLSKEGKRQTAAVRSAASLPTPFMRRDDIQAYQLAGAVDDAAMLITEIVLAQACSKALRDNCY